MRREWLWFALVVLTALVLRAAWIAEAARMPFFELPQTDDFVYAQGAQRIAAGDLWLRGEPLRFGPWWFYVLAAVMKLFGDGAMAPRIVQVLMGVCAVVAVWATVRRVAGPRYALLAAALMAVYAPEISYEALLLPETLGVLLHALLALAVVRAVDARRPVLAWAAVGVVLGVAIGLRPSALALAVPCAWAALSRRESCSARDGDTRDMPDTRETRDTPDTRDTLGARASRLAVLATSAALLVAPVVVRSVVATGSPALAGTAGINLFIGNGPGASGIFRVPPEVPGSGSPATQAARFREVAERSARRPLSDGDADAYWVRRTLAHMASHPAHAAWLLLYKTRLFWNARELSALVDFGAIGGHDSVLGALPGFEVLGPFAFAGTLLLLARGRPRAERTLSALLLCGSLPVIALFVQDRYRLPLIPLAIPVAALYVRDLLARLRDGNHAATLRALLPLAVGLALAFPPAKLRGHAPPSQVRETARLAD